MYAHVNITRIILKCAKITRAGASSHVCGIIAQLEKVICHFSGINMNCIYAFAFTVLGIIIPTYTCVPSFVANSQFNQTYYYTASMAIPRNHINLRQYHATVQAVTRGHLSGCHNCICCTCTLLGINLRRRDTCNGPLLFIIYTNDLPKSLTKTKTILFYDDTTIFKSSNNIETLHTAMNKDLQILEDWFKANKLSLNASKTNYIILRKNKSELNYMYTRCKLMIKEIGLVSKTKLLGIIIDEHLEWKYQLICARKNIMW